MNNRLKTDIIYTGDKIMLWIWIGLVVALLLIEVLTKKLITIWYVLSGIISFILSFFTDSYLIQFLVFSILGTVLLFVLRDYFIKKIETRNKA